MKLLNIKLSTLLATAFFLLCTFISYSKSIIVGNQSSSSINFTGFNPAYKYCSSEFIINASEINDSGKIKSISFYKTTNDSLITTIDSISIYIKETDSNTIGNFASTSGYVKVFNGSILCNPEDTWISLPFSSTFIYSGSKNISILIVRNNGTKRTSNLPGFSVSYDAKKNFSAAYFSSNVNPWKSTPPKTFQNINGQYRPFIQLEIE